MQLVLSPASDSFKVTEREKLKKSEEECEMMRRKEESQDTIFPKRTN